MATNDNIQHGIDDNPSGDAEKGAALGGLGGIAVGAAAGSIAGPVGTLVGAVAGGLLGAGASGAAVAAVDAVDNDNTVSGVGHGATTHGTTGYAASNIHASSNAPVTGTDVGGHNVVTGGPATTEAGNTGLAGGALVGGTIGAALGGPVGAVVGGAIGSLTGGAAGDATEAVEDTAAVDQGARSYAATSAPNVHASQGTPVAYTSGATNLNNAGQGFAAANNFEGDAFRASAGMASNPTTDIADTRDMYHGTTSVGAADLNADTPAVGGLGGEPVAGVRMGGGNQIPGVQTGGVTTQGQDTRGIFEKGADALTGDRMDDKTGGRVLNEPTPNAANTVRGAAQNAGTTISNTAQNTGATISGATQSAGNTLSNAAQSAEHAAHNVGSSVAGAVRGVVGDVTHPDNGVPGVQTGGVTTAGQDTRGITEKVADAVTGDNRDDKTGGVVR